MVLQVWPDSTTLRYNVLRTEDGVTTFTGSGKSVIVTGRRRSGTENPQWREMIRLGLNATTGLSAQEFSVLPVKCHAYVVIDGKKASPFGLYITCDEWCNQQYWGYPAVATSIDPTIFASTDSRARERFLKKYRAARTAFQSGVFAGELLETVRMLMSPAKSLRRGVNDYYRTVKHRLKKRKGKPPKTRDLNKIVGDTWLEYVFGWRPAIRDVQDAASLICARPERYRERIVAWEVYDWYDEPIRVFRSGDSIGYPYWYEYHQQQNLVKVVYRGGADLVLGTPDFPEQLGLSWSNLLPTVWELIPYSFLVDYFTSIGSVIEGFSTGTVLLSYGCRTKVGTRHASLATSFSVKDMKGALGHSFFHGGVSGHGDSGHSKVVSRDAIGAVDFGSKISDYHWNLPGVGSLKWLNIAALATLRR